MYRDAVVPLFGTQVELAVKEDVSRAHSEPEHVEGEVSGGSQSVFLHLHRSVSTVCTAVHKQENKLCSGVHRNNHKDFYELISEQQRAATTSESLSPI